MTFTCTQCGKQHDEWPALAYSSPAAYHDLSQQDKEQIAEMSSDFCVIHHPDQTDRFIRATLTLRVKDHCQDLDYGIWVSLSEKSFQDYWDNFENPNHETQYFGWFASNIPQYDMSVSIPTTVHTRTGRSRPEVVPHSNCEHQLAVDYYDGITKAEAERRIQAMMDAIK